MLAIPTTPKEFNRWLAPRRDLMPADLYAKGVFARLSLASRDQKAWKQSPALRRAGKREWREFTTDPRLPGFIATYLD